VKLIPSIKTSITPLVRNRCFAETRSFGTMGALMTQSNLFLALWLSTVFLFFAYWWTAPAMVAPYGPACRLAPSTPRFPDYSIAVFGGSTSTGEGASDSSSSWPEVLRRAVAEQTGADVSVHNFARGATGADYFATCFQRYVDRPYDVVLLEYSINGGNVTRLVDQIRTQMNTTIFLVKQLSCKSSTGGPAAPLSLLRFGEGQQTAAYLHRLIEFDFSHNLTANFGSPCSADSMEQLFDPGHHHLGDLGHGLLGAFVADNLMTHYFANSDHFKGKLTETEVPETCFFGDAVETACDRGQCSIATEFSGDGWEFRAEKVDREDKVCWQTSENGAVLESTRPWSFQRLAVFAEKSFNKTGRLEVACGDRVLASFSTRRPAYSLVEMLTPEIEKECKGQRLRFKNVHAPGGRFMSRVCGVVMS
jgi:hypothetical protein